MVVFIFLLGKSTAQTDSIKIQLAKTPTFTLKTHSPKLASYLSIVPGAGQVYNKKYWKVPIIYAGLGTAAYFIYYYNNTTQFFRNEYIYRINNEVSFHNPLLQTVKTDNILALRNTYRSRMEIAIAAIAIVYALNIIDATVDAHLYYFDISDDLSMSIKPNIQMYQINDMFSFTPALGLKLKIK